MGFRVDDCGLEGVLRSLCVARRLAALLGCPRSSPLLGRLSASIWAQTAYSSYLHFRKLPNYAWKSPRASRGRAKERHT